MIVQTSPAKCLLHALKRLFIYKKLTCLGKVCARVLPIEKDHKIPVFFVHFRRLRGVSSVEELRQLLTLNLMDLLNIEPICRAWGNLHWIHCSVSLHLKVVDHHIILMLILHRTFLLHLLGCNFIHINYKGGYKRYMHDESSCQQILVCISLFPSQKRGQ